MIRPEPAYVFICRTMGDLAVRIVIGLGAAAIIVIELLRAFV